MEGLTRGGVYLAPSCAPFSPVLHVVFKPPVSSLCWGKKKSQTEREAKDWRVEKKPYQLHRVNLVWIVCACLCVPVRALAFMAQMWNNLWCLSLSSILFETRSLCCFSAVCTRLASPRESGNSPLLSHVALGALELTMHTTTARFAYYLKIWTRVHTLAWETLPHPEPWCSWLY